jgi:hypothetical protein
LLLKGVSNEGLLITGAGQEADGILLEVVEEIETVLVEETESGLDEEAESVLDEVKSILLEDEDDAEVQIRVYTRPEVVASVVNGVSGLKLV